MRTITAAEVPGFFAPGQKVYVGASSNEPVALLDALAAAPGCAAEIEFVHFPLAQLNTRDLTALDLGAGDDQLTLDSRFLQMQRLDVDFGDGTDVFNQGGYVLPTGSEIHDLP